MHKVLTMVISVILMGLNFLTFIVWIESQICSGWRRHT